MRETELTELERNAVAAAVPAWCRAWVHASKVPSGNPKVKNLYHGETADEILERHGIGVGYRRGVVTWAVIAGAVMEEGKARVNDTERPYNAMTPARLIKAVQMYSRGTGVHRIAAVLGCNRSVVYRALVQRGVPMRGRGGK